jgi:hopanoid C-3 methylase HpnR
MMKTLCVHPSGLMYNEIFLRLEPLGVELIAASLRRAGHDVRLLDLQAAQRRDFRRLLDEFRPDAVLIGMNYLANLPEVIELCQLTKARLPRALTCVGGHSASFTARELLEHAAGAIECVVRGEGEEAAPKVVAAWRDDPTSLHELDGVVTLAGEGPPPKAIHSLDDLRPARDLLQNRKKYFIGVLDPAASIEFSRGCPWDCSFCSAWTFYGRSYRKIAPEICAEDLASIRETGVFIVDDVAFIQAEHGHAIADAIERRGIRKRYYLETRGDVLLRNKELFQRWKKLGLEYMFLGLEAIDAEGLKAFRKRVSLGKNFEALEYARSLGIMVAVNIIADTDWDEARFKVIREWALSVPEIVNITVNTPYPGTETFFTNAQELTTKDYRLFDIQHAVLPTKLPLVRFYEELVKTQQVLNRKHLGWTALKATAAISARLLMQGQTNFVRMLWKFNSVYDAKRQVKDHLQPVTYEMKLPEVVTDRRKIDPRRLYVLPSTSKAAQANALITAEAERG